MDTNTPSFLQNQKQVCLNYYSEFLEYTSSELVFMSQLDPIWIKSVTGNFDVLAEAFQEREEI